MIQTPKQMLTAAEVALFIERGKKQRQRYMTFKRCYEEMLSEHQRMGAVLKGIGENKRVEFIKSSIKNDYDLREKDLEKLKEKLDETQKDVQMFGRQLKQSICERIDVIFEIDKIECSACGCKKRKVIINDE